METKKKGGALQVMILVICFIAFINGMGLIVKDSDPEMLWLEIWRGIAFVIVSVGIFIYILCKYDLKKYLEADTKDLT